MKRIQFGMRTDQGIIATDGYLLEIFDWIKLVVHKVEKGWAVSEFSSGGRVTPGAIALRTDAIKAAKHAVEQTGKDAMVAKIAAFIEANTPKPIAPPQPVARKSNRVWPKVGDIVQLRYGAKTMQQYAPKLQARHARVLLIAAKSPKNCLCMLRGGAKVVVNIGNLFV